MKMFNRIISAVLFAIMCVSFGIPMCAAASSTAEEDSFSGINEDQYSVVSWNKDNLTHAMNEKFVATLESYKDEICVKMVKQNHSFSNFQAAGSAYVTNFNVAINPGDAEYEANDLAYCVVRYASVSEKAYSLWFWCPDFHSDGRRAEKIADVGAGKKDWADSGIITVTEGLKKRINAKSQVVITADTTDMGAEIYIGDIIFFETMEAAENYLSNNNAGKASAKEDAGDGLTEQYKLLMLLVGKRLKTDKLDDEEKVLTSPFDGIKATDYAVYNLNDGSSTYGGNACLKMTKGAGTVSATNASGGPSKAYTYRADINPGEDDYKNESNLAYCVINYASCSTVAHEIFIWSPKLMGSATTDSRVETVAEVDAGNTGWINTQIITVTAGLKDRIKGTNSFTIASTAANGNVYISSIIFFKNEADAEKYLEQYEKYYAANPVIPKPFDGIDEANYSVVKWTTDNLKSGNQKTATVIEDNGDTYVKMVSDDWKPSKFNSDGSVYDKTKMYSAAINPGNTEYTESNLAYMVVNYKTVNADSHGLYVYCPSYNTGDAVRSEKIADAPANSNGWINSGVVAVTAGLKNRINGSGQVSFISDSQSANAEIYISSIIFFKNEADAEKYLEQYEKYYAANPVIPKPFDGIDEANYSVVKWTSDNLKSGNQKTATVIEDNGDTYVKMVSDDWKPSKFNSDGSVYAKTKMYSAAINPGNTEYTESNLAYMVVNYKTVNADSHGLYVYCPSYNTGDAVRSEKIADAPANSNGWINSGVVAVTAGLKNRINGNGQVSFISDSQSANAEIYISSIIFFKNEADAQTYIKQYSDYYA